LSKKEVIIHDLSLENDLETAKTMRNAGLNATFAHPVIVRGKILGSIHFSFKYLLLDTQVVLDSLHDPCVIDISRDWQHTILRTVAADNPQRGSRTSVSD